MKWYAWLFLCVVCSGIFCEKTLASSGSPTQAIIDLERQLESYKVGKNLTEAEKEANRKLKEDVIKGTFNVAELCRVSMKKHWDEISADQQAEFIQVMTELLQKKAIFSKEQSETQGKSYYVKYDKEVPVDGDPNMVRVYTRVVIPKNDVTVNLSYKLRRENGGWGIFDVIVDDSSLVTNYAFQFHSIIVKHGYPELLKRMKDKLATLGSPSSAGEEKQVPEVAPSEPAPPAAEPETLPVKALEVSPSAQKESPGFFSKLVGSCALSHEAK